MKKRNALAWILTLAMVIALMAGCGNSGAGTSTSGDAQAPAQTEAAAPAQTQAAAPAQTEAAAPAQTEAAAPDEEDEDMAEITVLYCPVGGLEQPGVPDVEAAINEITEPEINVHVHLYMLDSGQYAQQVGLMYAGGETVDLMVTIPFGSCTFTNMLAQNQFVDITDLMHTYGQGALDTLGDLINSTMANGRIYGATTYRDLVVGEYLIMRKDVLDDLGLTEKAQNMKSFTEYEEILDAVKASEKYGNLAGIVNSDSAGLVLPLAGGYLGVDNFSDASCYDQLGDLNKLVSINPDGSDPTVKMNFETPEYRAMIEKVRGWYEKGYIYQDAANTEEHAESLIKSNVGFSWFTEGELGLEATKEAACGYPVVAVKIIDQPISTSSCTKFVWAVPTVAVEPEAAIKFLNLMYTDARIENLFCWGVEGMHYQVVNGEAQFLDGQDIDSCEYHHADWLFGNQFLAWPWQGQGANVRELGQAEMDNAIYSKYLGFICDTSEIQTELSAVVNVIAEYGPSLESGVAEPGTLDEYIEKLYASGAQKIIDEYQRQLDEWLANN